MNFLDHIITFTVTAMLTIGGFFGLVQSPVLPNQALQLGATIATTSQSDTIGTFRTNVNTSLENLNNQLNSVSSTVGTYGNLALENSPLAVLKGGTGTTTVPTEGKFFVSNGTTPTWKTATFGGGLTYTTTTTGFTLNTAGIDSSANYTWTGGHIFSASSTFTGGLFSNSTSTLGNTIIGGTTSTINSTNLNVNSTNINLNGLVNVNATSTFNKQLVFNGGFYNGFTSYMSSSLSSSTLLVATATTTRAVDGGTYTKYKDFNVDMSGIYNTIMVLNDVGEANFCARVYVNDVAVGTERCVSGAATYSELVTGIKANDNIQLYAKIGDGSCATHTCEITSFSIYGVVLPTASVIQD